MQDETKRGTRTRAGRGGEAKAIKDASFRQSHQASGGCNSVAIAKGHKRTHAFISQDASKIMADVPKHSIASGAFSPR